MNEAIRRVSRLYVLPAPRDPECVRIEAPVLNPSGLLKQADGEPSQPRADLHDLAGRTQPEARDEALRFGASGFDEEFLGCELDSAHLTAHPLQWQVVAAVADILPARENAANLTGDVP